MKTNNISRHRSTSLKTIVLAATFAIVFWSIQANAYPLHNGDYLFWSEMPTTAAQVLADYQGTNGFDTDVRRTAALFLLSDLVKVEMDGKGHGRNNESAQELKLSNAYMYSLPWMNRTTSGAQIIPVADRLDADPAFVQSFLNRYFSEAAVHEIEPLVPVFESNALKDIASYARQKARGVTPPDAQGQISAANGQGKTTGSLHNGDYLFWPEMPAAAQVLTDMKGANDLDTAARQHAALTLLIALVNVAADGTGQTPWPARELELNGAYYHALPDGDGHRAEMQAKSLKLQADPTFVQPFLSRYFTVAALDEIKPKVAGLEAGATNQIARISAQKKQVDEAYAQNEIADSNMFSQMADARLHRNRQAEERDRKGLLEVEFVVFTYIALTIIFGILWICRICLAFGTVRTTSDDPPRIEGTRKNQTIQSFTGRVQGRETRSATTVSGSIRTVTGNPAMGVGNRVEGTISSKTTVTDSFRLVNPRNQQEENFAVQDYHVQLFENQLVSVAWAIPENRTSGPVFLVINHTTSNEIFTSKADLWEVFHPGFKRAPFWRRLTFLTFPLNWVLVIIWEILVDIQIKRFRQSGTQPLVEALNRKAAEFS